MKLSTVVHYGATFGLSAIGILTVAGILSLAERNLHADPEPAYAAHEESVHTSLVDPISQPASPHEYLHSGYWGDFGYVAPLPVVVGPAGRLPQVTTVSPPQPATTQLAVAPQPSAPVAVAAEPTAQEQVKRPTIRVGLFTVESQEEIQVSVDRRVQLVTGSGEVVKKNIKKNRKFRISYDEAAGTYTVRRGERWSFTSTDYIRVEPKRPHAVATIHTFENRPAWDTSINDNEFLGTLELQYAPETELIWTINELGVENYVKGIAEASNDNDPAYLKALMTAARTYVYTIGDKHDDEPYDVDTTANDQVYKGYGFTQRAPNVAAAVEATRGRVVHYKGEPVITPYFSRSDGRTRAWEEVWFGSKEYLVSKEDPCCVDEELYGHGVGMSALGARYFAEEEDWGWKKILKYYYTGVTVPAIW